MIYITGDTHGNMNRFYRKSDLRRIYNPGENDYVIVCGDFGLLWSEGNELQYNLSWMSELPFTLLWVQGNHENYDMIEKFPIEMWRGGRVRHIVRDKIILMERGQVFEIDGKKIFTFGGASSHDIQDGILNPKDFNYEKTYKKMKQQGKNFRVLGKSWWPQELPNTQEMQEGRINLEKAEYKVDYVISHCMSNIMLKKYAKYYWKKWGVTMEIEPDVLTDYFDEIEIKLQYDQWFCGHYHEDLMLDKNHIIVYWQTIPIR